MSDRTRLLIAAAALIALAMWIAGCSSPTAPTNTPPPIISDVPPVTTPPVTTPPTAPAPPAPNPLLTDPRFDLNFYRQFVNDALETPSRFPLARWQRAPLIYIRTVDELNDTVAARLLDQTAAAIINTISLWTGGSFGVAGVETGTGTREGQAGWLTLKWRTTGTCGLTYGIGTEGGTVEMNHRRQECTCGPLVVKHELGHAMGFYHTDSPADLMAPSFVGICDKNPSAREVFHARIAYQMPLGSFDPR